MGVQGINSHLLRTSPFSYHCTKCRENSWNLRPGTCIEWEMQSSRQQVGAHCSGFPASSAQGDILSRDTGPVQSLAQFLTWWNTPVFPPLVPSHQQLLRYSLILCFDSCIFLAQPLDYALWKHWKSHVLGRLPVSFLNWEEWEKSGNCCLPSIP